MKRLMKSPIVKRSVVIGGHRTSVSLEDAFWAALKEIAHGRDTSLSNLVGTIDTNRAHGNLSSAIRLFVLDHYRQVPAPLTAEQSVTAELPVTVELPVTAERAEAAPSHDAASSSTTAGQVASQ
jgi:predicted DNA-binding ribbon-helix-helix protein